MIVCLNLYIYGEFLGYVMDFAEFCIRVVQKCMVQLWDLCLRVVSCFFDVLVIKIL